MAKAPKDYEIPTEMRELAGKSVDQAKKAFDGFLGAANKAVAAVDSQTASAQHSSSDLAKKAIGYAEHNVAAAFDLAQKLVHAKDIQDVVKIQTEFVKSQIGALQSQMTDFGSTMQESARKAASDVQATVESAASEVRRAAADAVKHK